MYRTFINIKRSRGSLIALLVVVLNITLANISICYSSTINNNFTFKQYSDSDGLSHSTVNDICQDRLGFIWLATMDGLCRFDGYNFKVFRSVPNNENSLNHNVIKSVAVGNDDVLWIGTVSGLCRLNLKTNYFRRVRLIKNNLKYCNVEKILIDTKGRVWIATQGDGVFVINGKKVKNIRAENDILIPNNNVHSLYQDKSGRIWAGTEGGIVCCIDNKPVIGNIFELQQEKRIKRSLNCVRTISEDSRGNLWAGTWGGGVAKINNKSGDINYFRFNIKNVEGISDSRVISSRLLKDGRLIFGTEDGGLCMMNPDGKSFFNIKKNINVPFGLKSNNIRTVFQSESGLVWLGTSGAGVFVFNPEGNRFNNSKNIFNVGSLPENLDIYSIIEYNGVIFLGTNGAGVIRVRDGHSDLLSHNTSVSTSLGGNIVHAITVDRSGGVWFGTLGGGLNFLVNPKHSKEFINYNTRTKDLGEINYNDIRVLYFDSHGKLWVGTAGGGINIVNKLRNNKIEVEVINKSNYESFSNNDVYAVIETKNGDFWVGTSYGLNRIKKTDDGYQIRAYYRDITNINSLSGNHINCLKEISINRLLIGTDSGLNIFNIDKNKFELITESDGLANNVVKSIEVVNDNEVWISTTGGLSHYDMKTKKFQNYYIEDGLTSNEFNTNSSYKDEEGRFYFGGTNGINFFYSQNNSFTKMENRVILTDFKLGTQSVSVSEKFGGIEVLDSDISVTKSINLTNEYNNFTFEFSSSDYENNHRIKYAYRLQGFESDWNIVDSKHCYASYTNISHGDYKFQIKAQNSDLAEETSVREVVVNILPPLWLTWYAKLFYFIALGFLIVAVYSYFHNKAVLKRKLYFANVEKEKEHVLNEMRKEFFTNVSHDIRTPLSLILSPSKSLLKNREIDFESRQKLKSIEQNAELISRLANQLMDFDTLDRGEMKLNLRRVEINSFVNRIKSLFEVKAIEKNIKYELNSTTSGTYVWLDAEKIEKVLFNILSNAFKFTQSNDSINISIEISDCVYITIEDSGSGISDNELKKIFNRNYRGTTSEHAGGFGIGLYIAKELVEFHKGSIKAESDNTTRFIVKLPIDDECYKNSDKFVINNSKFDELLIDTTSEYYSNGEKIVLIVEDNAELLRLLKKEFSGEFNVLTASNGSEGIKLATENVPDLIISDVMMPEMNGFVMCEKLKGNIDTSHIPIVLLTAKSLPGDNIYGLNTGADDYVVKPFDQDILKAKVKSILKNRDRIAERFKDTKYIENENSKLSALDRTFINKLDRFIENNISSTELTVETLGEAVGMSRTTLYRKIKALTGMTAIEYIRRQRILYAANLIKNGESEIVIVAEKSGFQDVAYFRKCFKEIMGVKVEDI